MNLKDLQNAEHFGFMHEVHGQVMEVLPAAIDVEKEFATFDAALADEDNSFKIVTKSALTQKLELFDGDRDGIFTGMRGRVKSSLNHYDPETREAAYRLMVLIDGYGSLASESYDRETAGIYNLIKDQRSDKYSDDVDKLNIKDWVDKLEEANNAFEGVMRERYTEQLEKDSATRLRDARLNTDMAYAALRNKVNAGIIFNGPEKYEAFVRELNVRIARFKTTVAQRRGRSAAAADDNEEDNK